MLWRWRQTDLSMTPLPVCVASFNGQLDNVTQTQLPNGYYVRCNVGLCLQRKRPLVVEDRGVRSDIKRIKRGDHGFMSHHAAKLLAVVCYGCGEPRDQQGYYQEIVRSISGRLLKVSATGRSSASHAASTKRSITSNNNCITLTNESRS